MYFAHAGHDHSLSAIGVRPWMIAGVLVVALILGSIVFWALRRSLVQSKGKSHAKNRRNKLTILKFGLIAAALIAAITLAAMQLGDNNVAVLNPRGTIAEQQRSLLFFTVLLSSLVIVPVFVLTVLISWKFRGNNKKARYTPNWDHNPKLELIWWGIPFTIIFILSIITWVTTHSLDPYKPLDSDKEPVNIQVVAMQWKWLFIYPDEDIATVNFFQIPVDTPINLEITADAPMNSFWVPQLGGQIYAMNGMVTKLHLEADEAGDYHGVSANISGEGFADMRFVARASSQNEFEDWVDKIKQSPEELDLDRYNQLALPAVVDEPLQFTSKDKQLYDTIVMKFMKPHGMPHNEGNEVYEHSEATHEH